MSYSTEQEEAWAGAMGDAYGARHPSPLHAEANVWFFRSVFADNSVTQRDWPIQTILELGCGSGANMRALKSRFPKARITGLEINHHALAGMQEENPDVTAVEQSVLAWQPEERWDLVLTKGLLIHIVPDFLPAVYAAIELAARRFVLLAEYYNPTPLEVPYRGERERLWKRDFAGEFLDRYPEFQLLDAGFIYHRMPHPQDDLHWFLIQRKERQ